jgi:hypothetical protein
MTAGGQGVFELYPTIQRLGTSTDSRIVISQALDSVDIYAGATQVADLTINTQTLGVAGDNAKLVLDQSNTKATLYANNTFYLEIEAAGGGGGTLKYFDDNTEIISANTTEIYVGDSGAIADGTRFYASFDNEHLHLDAGGFSLMVSSAGLNLDPTGAHAASVDINQVLNTVDGDAIDASSTDSQLATAKLLYNTIGNITPNEITQGDSYVRVTDSTDVSIASFVIDSVQEAQIDTDGLTLASGASVNEFSTDGTLAGDSDDAVPTEKAVKTYVDTKVYSGIADLGNGDATAIVVFDTAQDDADYVITTQIVNNTDPSPAIFLHMTTDYDEFGFTEIFSGPLDSGNYKLHYQITRLSA